MGLAPIELSRGAGTGNNVRFQTLIHTRSTNQAVAVGRAIGEHLRAAYGEPAQEPLPRRHLDLLQQLDGNETGQKPGSEPAQEAQQMDAQKQTRVQED
jgi:hypothetical protein